MFQQQNVELDLILQTDLQPWGRVKDGIIAFIHSYKISVAVWPFGGPLWIGQHLFGHGAQGQCDWVSKSRHSARKKGSDGSQQRQQATKGLLHCLVKCRVAG